MANIRVTPETLAQQATELTGYAEDLRTILKQVGSKINEVIDGWDGLAQDSYFALYETMKESLDQFPEVVQSLGDATAGAANAFAEVDEKLSQSFSSAGN